MRLNALEDDDHRLKQLLADAMLDNVARMAPIGSRPRLRDRLSFQSRTHSAFGFARSSHVLPFNISI